jgi:hypothetical protein
MPTLTVTVSVGLVGCRREVSIEIDDDLPEDGIESIAEDLKNSVVEWTYRVDEK